jgi:hypothetical protein
MMPPQATDSMSCKNPFLLKASSAAKQGMLCDEIIGSQIFVFAISYYIYRFCKRQNILTYTEVFLHINYAGGHNYDQ